MHLKSRLHLAALALLLPCAVFANPSAFDKTIAGPGPADDVAFSMGVFRIIVDPAYRPWFQSNLGPGPFWDGVSRLTSPVLYDFATKIGRSAAHQQDDAADVGGTPVGTAGTPVSDANLVFPPGYNTFNPLRYEVHTEIRSLDLQTNHCGVATVCGGNLPMSVRGGTGLGLALCPGEIESNSNDGFPAKSFFNVFVQVDIGGPAGFGIVKNNAPLLVTHDPINGFPPTVVYIHENSTAVPVYFKNSGTTGLPPFISWNAGTRFGYLVLAGHAEDLRCGDTLTCEQFWNNVTSGRELPLPAQTGISDEQALASFALGPVSPNPSNGRTDFEYVVGREARVRVSIVDIQGRTMAVLAEGVRQPGRYQATWTGKTGGRDAPTGLYFVRYETLAKTVVQRMTLAR